MKLEQSDKIVDADTNPFRVESTAHRVVVSRQTKTVAAGIACLVGFGSFAIMVALLFGIVVAIAGQTLPASAYSGAFLKSESGKRFYLLGVAAIPIAMLLGLFCYSRIMRAQRLILEADLRREDLKAQLAMMKQSMPD